MPKTPTQPSMTSRGAALKSWVRALESSKLMEEAPTVTLAAMLDTLAERHGDRPALLGEGEHLSFRELAARANRHARWAMAEGLAAGDVVCLLMPNRPDYIAIWLGLTRVGCVVALLNTNLVAGALLHGIRAAGSNSLIVAGALVPAVAAIADQLPPDARVWVHGDPVPDRGWPAIGPLIEQQSAAPLGAADRDLPAQKARALLIYTSGTTGLPKAAVVTHRRIMEWSLWFAGIMEACPEDRLYDCLPMYHSVGGIVAIGAMLVSGGSVLIRARFSASRFWDDVVDGDCTIFQYIGELCRYLVGTPAHPKERLHRLRLACGNGLRGDVWNEFQQRFAMPRILEFYAATEGGVSLYNCEGKPGAIGRVPSFLAHRFPVALIRCDAQTGELQRDATGFCVACEPDEAGEAIGLLTDATRSAARQFDGYTDPSSSASKVLRDVFAKGDLWYRSGDLMRKDAAGYFYFVDRIGDTFRWKGENVSTTEVASVLQAYPGVTDAVVYGVAVPNHEGRAGMAAITTDERFDLGRLNAHLAARLPGYAQPLFLRRCEALDVTGTFKLMKGNLAREGYTATAGPIWFNDHGAGRFVAFDTDLARSIGDGTRRV